MIKRVVFSAVVFLISLSVSAQSQEEFIKKLYTQGVVSLAGAKKKCAVLSRNNKQLLVSMQKVYKIAKEKRNPSTKVLAETDYLLGFLQERIDDVCSRINLANEETVKLIIASESKTLIGKMQQSKNFSDYIDKIFGTEYSKFLYLTATPESLEKMHRKWAQTMASERKNAAQMITHINKGNKVLREELTQFTKAFKLYYEDAAGMFDEKKKMQGKPSNSK
jgi:hypothetical protein